MLRLMLTKIHLEMEKRDKIFIECRLEKQIHEANFNILDLKALKHKYGTA